MARRIRAVVLNYRDASRTLQAVAELRRSRGVDVDVLVVDSASGPDDAAALRAGLSPERLLLLTENRGYAGGMNAGLRFWRDAAAREPVLLVTPDARLDDDVAGALLDTLEADPAAAVVGPVVVYAREPRLKVSAGGTLDPARARLGALTEARGMEPYAVEWIDGCCMLLRPEAVEEVGGFDEAYFLYFEEIDLCHRLGRAGWRVLVDPRNSVSHPKAPGTMPPHFFYYMTRNAYRFWGRSFGTSALRPAAVSVFVTLRFAALAAASLVLPGRWSEARARLRDLVLQVRGAWAGTRDHLRGRYGPRPGPTPPPARD